MAMAVTPKIMGTADTAFIAAVGVVLAALISGIVAYFTTRKKTAVDAQGVITTGFKQLVDSLGEEVERQTALAAKCQADVDVLKRRVDALQAQNVRYQALVQQLKEFIRNKGLLKDAQLATLTVLPLDEELGGDDVMIGG